MTTNDIEKNNPTWFITGCSTGFGRALATYALERGDRVVATARDVTSLAALEERFGDRVLTRALDVTDPASVTRAVADAEDAFGRIDVLVNNAGYGYLAAIEEGEDDAVRRLFDTNLFGVVTVLKAVLPGMRARRAGRIVNVSSFGGLAAFAGTGYYHSTKFALEGLSESLAAEVAPLGIAVTLVEPGGLRTEWAGSSMQQSPVRLEDYEQTAGRRREATLAVSGKQPGDPERAAAAVGAVVDLPEPPLRLLLGSDALRGARARLDRLAEQIDAYEKLTVSADADQS
jgi:NAD(P)-dependent dehydrogenase (short-subunit alcohol dehydrogenase family)